MDDRISVTHADGDPVSRHPLEFVERKGIGHPDSLCDGVAEAVSRRLSRFYRDEFGRIHHHNTDKVHLGAGRSRPVFGGGTVVDPIYVLVGGRATTSVDGESLPIDDLATAAARDYLLETVPELDPEHVVVETRIGQTSGDLGSLFDRGEEPLANDTSIGVGHAPGTQTEQFVRTLEPRLHRELSAVGKDVKLMALRRGDRLSLTVAAAVLDSAVDNLNEYRDVLAQIESLIEQHAESTIDYPVSVTVNNADNFAEGQVYLTTTGLSAEAGDDGSVGRGNRANGLITPHRQMSLEATAGKNPLTHVGKLYNLLSLRIARRLHDELGATYSGVELLSRIGDPVAEPWAVDVVSTVDEHEAVRDAIVDEFGDLDDLRSALLDGRLPVF
ncbi:methionine adenosyltransferase [Haloferax sp. MBLA0076]|uniref:Methionine adenosyltransferase n=1 Tax=Haloferax litoreum TaxID=2666140 RepID=A0A6A8GKZ3_9EURY|nr:MULTISPECIES: methionine adenosyltransferase [Haloferax]KAB1193783.1 methionine adenosyltransferase [Haloferax sp. CBA1148]MRX22320.1 methionine adenosyltransferase [Haloferax litoreum]